MEKVCKLWRKWGWRIETCIFFGYTGGKVCHSYPLGFFLEFPLRHQCLLKTNFIIVNSSTLEKELKSEKEQRQTLQQELHQEKDTTTLLKTELQQVEGLKKVHSLETRFYLGNNSGKYN